MEPKLLLPGIEDESAKQEPGLSRFLKVEVKSARKIDAISRGIGDAAFTPVPSDVAPDDIVEMEFENGGRRWKQWVTADQLRELGQQRTSRDGEQAIFLPHSWEAQGASRGAGAILLKALKIFGIDTPEKLAEKGASNIALGIADKFESDIAKQGHPFGLYRFPDPQKIERNQQIKDAKELSGNAPLLIFIHGTASSSIGSFGKLAGTTEWEALQKAYGNRIFALDHRTFSVSPLQNALDLAQLLPAGAQLHLVSHSRGGLVGELICLAQAGDSRAKFDELVQVFLQKDADDATRKAIREKQVEQLKVLWDLLLEKKLTVQRFVRVACPAHGTTLAGKRMDYLASGVLNAVGQIPFIGQNPILDAGYDWLKALLLTLVKKKADPKDLPGIESMTPDSPLVEFLNHPKLSTRADLAVISGDIEVGNLKLTIPALLGNAFFWAKNDLVVNTKAMTQGIRRQEKAYDFFDQGQVVCHFNYFLNDKTRQKLAGWLLRSDETPVAGFKELFADLRFSRGGVAPAATEATDITAWLEKPEPPGAVESYELRVTVSHGDLRHAKYPVAVGHYDGDGIISAEKYLDRLLDGRLANRFGTKLYPGPVGTAEVVLAPEGRTPRGALVIGLGDMGDISVDAVRQGVLTAALRYAVDVLEQRKTNPQSGPASAAFSSLLIGTYGGNALSVKQSVTAILEGATQANRILREQELWNDVRIDHIELVELYEDVAIQAIHAVHELSKNKALELAKEVDLKVTPRNLNSMRGGRYKRPISEFDTYWYGKIQVTAVKDPHLDLGTLAPRLPKLLGFAPDLQVPLRSFVDKLIEEAIRTPQKRTRLAETMLDLMTHGQSGGERAAGLEFQVLTDRARVEATTQATQRNLVDWMVEQAVNSTFYDKELSVSLFELLLPNELKDHIENVVLLLDREAAQYPWELMTERSQPDKPLATRMGILRQFKTDDFRANPRPSRGRNVLVVGDTANTGMVELTGAQDEARAVAKLLGEKGQFEVKEKVKARGVEIINELFAREYQILHIAAHGNYDGENPDQSGVVLDDGRYLTAKELVNLRTVPDLVFINCCHLGKVDKSTLPLTVSSPHRLAASVAEELIKMGVKAVVAAGWAVDDAAALTFAEEFYRQMLKGESFGQAVLQARKETHKQHCSGGDGVNTWGAYQCYGNPNFRLNLGGAYGDSPSYYSRREYRDALKSLSSTADLQSLRRNESQRQQLLGIEKELRESAPTLLEDGEVLSDFGESWLKLGNFDEAIRFYELAIHSEDASAALRSLEHLANLQARHASQLWEKRRGATASTRATGKTAKARTRATDKSAREKEVAALRKKLDTARKLMDWLLGLDKTPERYSLSGKVFKCYALLAESNAAREVNLKKAKDEYLRGYKLAKERPGLQKNLIFPGVNVVACGLLLSGMRAADLQTIIEECRQALDRGLVADGSFWTAVAVPELRLLELLLSAELPKHEKDVIDRYTKVFTEYSVSPAEAESVLWQLAFLRAMIEARPASKQNAAVVKSLREIHKALLQLLEPKGA